MSKRWSSASSWASMVRTAGVEPALPGWKPGVLPKHLVRVVVPSRFAKDPAGLQPAAPLSELRKLGAAARCRPESPIATRDGVAPAAAWCSDPESNRASLIGNEKLWPMDYHRSMEVHPGVERGYRGLQPWA